MRAIVLSVALLLLVPVTASAYLYAPLWVTFTLTPSSGDLANAGEEATGKFLLSDPDAEYLRMTSMKLDNTDWMDWYTYDTAVLVAGQTGTWELSAWDYSFRNFRVYFEEDGTVRSPYFTEICATTYALGTWTMEPAGVPVEIPEPATLALFAPGVLALALARRRKH